MIHARKDYDRIQDPDNKIPLDEPVFLLRGQDPTAWMVVLEWLSKQSKGYAYDGRGVPTPGAMDGPMEVAVKLHAAKMHHWAKHVDHGSADVPEDQLRLF